MFRLHTDPGSAGLHPTDAVNPQLLLVHLWREAVQHLHAHRGLDVAQVELHDPAPGVQSGEFGLVAAPMLQQGRDQNLMVGAGFAHLQFVGKGAVLLGGHPLGTLKEVADVLRHRALDTSLIYANVDLTRLGVVAWLRYEEVRLPTPEGVGRMA